MRYIRMNLENKKQKLVPVSTFLWRLARYTAFATFLIAISVGIGVAGYSYFANMGTLDSFYMSCMILTGMGPVVEMKTHAAKIFSSFYALYCGIAFLSITAVFFAPIIHRLLHILQVDEE